MLTVLSFIYMVCAIALTAYAIGSVVLLLTYLRYRHIKLKSPTLKEYPTVAVQLPIYNEYYVVERLLESVAKLDYPSDKLFIQVLDDSTDITRDKVAEIVARLKQAGVQIEHVCRENREGFKAGALAYGLTLLNVKYVAVIDADFVLPSHFLKRIIPYLEGEPRIGMVQTRWGHLNSESNLLTRGQSLALDGHFVVEQTARNRAGWLMNFNGTGGVWRVKTIEQAGGWHDDTLTEDLDLSYRAQLIGWRFLYLPEVVVPGELPPNIFAYKQQQARWAKGGSQCMKLLLGPIWRNPDLSLAQKVMATLHLCQYTVHAVIILLLLLTPPLLITGELQTIPLGSLGLLSIAPPIIFVLSQYDLYTDWTRRILSLPALLMMGMGMAWTNARAVMSGLFSKRKEEFKRTPKYAEQRSHSIYKVKFNSNILWEGFLAVYCIGGAVVAWHLGGAYLPYLGLYALAFSIMTLWGVRDYLQLRRQTGVERVVQPTASSL